MRRRKADGFLDTLGGGLVMNEPRVMEAHGNHVLAVIFSGDGKRLISGGMDALIKVWAWPSLELEGTLAGHEKSVNCLALTGEDGTTLVSGSTDGAVRIWELPSGKPVGQASRVLPLHKKTVTALAASPDGRHLASASYDKTVKLFALASEGEAEPLTLKGHKDKVAAVAFVRKGERLASGGMGDEVLLWSVPDGQEVGRLAGHGQAVVSLAASSDGQRLVSVGVGSGVRLWNVATGKAEKSFPAGGMGMTPVTFSPRDDRLAIGSPGRVRVLTVEGGATVADLSVEVKGVYALAFAPDGRHLAMAAADKRVRIWELPRG